MSQNTLNTLMIVQIVMSVLMVVSILLQNRAEGLGSMFGGGGEIFRTKRGLEKFLYRFTFFLVLAFSVLSFIIVKNS
jgi:preprotein translocase subunit SecG